MNISILSVGPPYRGGISEQTFHLYSKLDKSHNVQLINFSRQYPEILFPGKSQVDLDSDLSIANNHMLIDSINPISWISSSNLILESSPDMIVMRFWNPFFALAHGFIVRRIKKKNPNVKIVAVCDNIIPHERRFLDKLLTKYLFNSIDGFIVMADGVEQELFEIVDKPKYKKVFHPVSFKNSAMAKSNARSRLNIKNEKIILFFGFIREYKGLDVLIKSSKYLKQKLKDYKIIVCGESYEGERKYLKLIEEHSNEGNIEWINDYIGDDLARIYFSACDVVVLPYKSASQSGVIPLSYSYNKPVIASNITGIKAMVSHGNTGFLFNKNDEKDLSNKIISFFNSDINYEQNIKEFKKQFSWDEFINKIFELYKEID